MPMVKVLRKCYDNRRLLKEGMVVEWRSKGPLPDYVELLDEDERPVKKTGGKGKPSARRAEEEEDDVI